MLNAHPRYSVKRKLNAPPRLKILPRQECITITPGQRVVLIRILEGESYAEAARTLGLSFRTVKNHIHNFRETNGLENYSRIDFISWLIKHAVWQKVESREQDKPNEPANAEAQGLNDKEFEKPDEHEAKSIKELAMYKRELMIGILKGDTYRKIAQSWHNSKARKILSLSHLQR